MENGIQLTKYCVSQISSSFVVFNKTNIMYLGSIVTLLFLHFFGRVFCFGMRGVSSLWSLPTTAMTALCVVIFKFN